MKYLLTLLLALNVMANDECEVEIKAIDKSLSHIAELLVKINQEIEAVNPNEIEFMKSNFIYREYLEAEANRNFALAQLAYVNSNFTVIKQMLQNVKKHRTRRQ